MKISDVVKKSYVSAILIFCAFLSMAGQGAYIPPDKPRLVIGIVVEQLKYDQLETPTGSSKPDPTI